MTLLLSGTDGLSDVDGSAATPAIRGTDANTGIFFPAADTIAFSEGGAEVMRLDSSGNVGIGTSSPSSRLQLSAASSDLSSAFGNVSIFSNDSQASDKGGSIGFGGVYQSTDIAQWSGIRGAKENGTSGNFAGYLSFFTRPNGGSTTERMRIDSSGNVGIGTSSPAGRLNIQGVGSSDNAATNQTLFLTAPASLLNAIKFNGAASTDLYIGRPANVDAISFGTVSAGERMRITADGDLLVAATSLPASAGSARIFSGNAIAASSGFYCKAGTAATTWGNLFNINWTGSPQLWIDTVNVGTFAFTSDYRVKRNIETQTAPALERVMALRPVTYQMADYGTLFKASEEVKEGFIAHEVQEVIPSGAEGVKDDETQIQSLRVDAILAVAVKAIQEQQALIQQLQADVAALKGV
jgi:hypothetical protein